MAARTSINSGDVIIFGKSREVILNAFVLGHDIPEIQELP